MGDEKILASLLALEGAAAGPVDPAEREFDAAKGIGASAAGCWTLIRRSPYTIYPPRNG
jgi:hypothetical protein